MFIFECFIVFCLILLNGIFAMSELAMVSAKKVHLKRLADEGSHAAQIALDFSQDTSRFLPTVQIGITLIGVLSGAFSGATLSEPLTHYLIANGISENNAEIASVSVIVASITYLTLIVGELVPKELALRKPERLALFVAPIIYWLSRLTSPLVTLLDVSCRIVLTFIRAGNKPETTVTEEEVRSMIDEGTEHGLFHATERDMISGIMLLADRPIRAFMLPRTDVILLRHDADIEELKRVVSTYHYSRYPVMKDSHVIGILQTKEILNHLLENKPWNVAELLQGVAIFPDVTPTLKVIEHLRRSAIHMATIVNEYGSFAGIVTLTDLVEVITGELYEHGDTSDEIVLREDGSWLVDGSILVDIALQKIGLPNIPQERSYHTLAGFLLHLLTHIPKTGEYIDHKGFRFEVVDMDGTRIDKVLITAL